MGVLRPNETLAKQTRRFQALFWLILAGTDASVFWASRQVARRLAAPLEQVARATEEIGRGEFCIRMDVHTGDEVESLAHAVRRMADDLKRYQEQLVQQTKLAASGEMASQMAHEFQNRISGLSLWIQFLDSQLDPEDPKRVYLEEMKKGLRSFLDQLDSLKQFYKTPLLHRLELDLNQLVQESTEYVRQRLEEGGIVLALDLDSRLPPLKLDGEKMKSVVINLLVNAMDAVTRGGRIDVETRLEEQSGAGRVRLSVTDNG